MCVRAATAYRFWSNLIFLLQHFWRIKLDWCRHSTLSFTSGSFGARFLIIMLSNAWCVMCVLDRTDTSYHIMESWMEWLLNGNMFINSEFCHHFSTFSIESVHCTVQRFAPAALCEYIRQSLLVRQWFRASSVPAPLTLRSLGVYRFRYALRAPFIFNIACMQMRPFCVIKIILLYF